MKAIAKNIRISPKKANLVAYLVRNKKVTDALDILKFTNKKAAPLIAKVIESAAANAENNLKQKRDSLVIKEVVINDGTTFKRHVPASRGRVHPIRKRNSHITVALATATEEKPAERPTKKPAEPAKPAEEKPSTPPTKQN
ncbi:50S ribosomal protein L22 [Candidatus Peregrinibacteria bacterium]|nr:50S ribosomal protein L22 [Candidatus Peregrinibacteria bacterium]MBT4055671.1 50S ribosomal protein L22 [Candidatus Peregrinibacteria bacterium]